MTRDEVYAAKRELEGALRRIHHVHRVIHWGDANKLQHDLTEASRAIERVYQRLRADKENECTTTNHSSP